MTTHTAHTPTPDDEIPPVSSLELSLWERIRLEPVMVVAVLEAVLVLLATFGLRLSIEQTGAILSLASLVLGLVARSQVVPASRIQTEIVSVETYYEDPLNRSER